MQYGILGAGAVGTYLGACLASIGARVCLVGRDPLARRVKEEGGVLIRRLTGEEVKLPLGIETDVQALGEAQVILLAVKSQDTREAARALAPVLREDAVLFSLQNGVRNPEILAGIFGEERVAAGVVTFNIVAAGHRFQQTTAGPVIVGRPKRSPARGDALASDLRAAQIEAEARDEMEPVLWGKLLLNLGNALSALTGLPIVEFVSNKDTRAIYRAAIEEGLMLLSKAGIAPARIGRRDPRWVKRLLSLPLPDSLMGWLARRMYGVSPEARSSTWDDLSRGKRTEIDFLNGEILHLAEKLGARAPVNEVLVRLLKQAEGEGRSPGISPVELRSRVGV